MKRIFLLVFCTASLLVAEESMTELRMEKRFGIGVSAAGPLGMFGMEVDLNVSEAFSIGAGLGTGIDYSTLMVKGRYFLLGKWVSPYFGAGLARWFSAGTAAKKLSPSVLGEKFLEEGQDLGKGFSVWLAYPVLGVQFMHPSGFAVFAEIQYLFKMISLANGTYAGLGMHWYF